MQFVTSLFITFTYAQVYQSSPAVTVVPSAGNTMTYVSAAQYSAQAPSGNGSQFDCEEVLEFDPALWDCQLVDVAQVNLNDFDCFEETDFSNFDCVDDDEEWICESEQQIGQANGSTGTSPSQTQPPAAPASPAGTTDPNAAATPSASKAVTSGAESSKYLISSALLGLVLLL